MKKIALLVAMLALVSSAMAWDLSETLQYTLVKSGFEQAGSADVLPQIIGTKSGAYVKEPNAAYGSVWGQVDNTLIGVTIDRDQAGGYVNPTYSAANNNFYVALTQGGYATMKMSAKDTISTEPEIQGTASAYQNLWLGGEFAKTVANFDSRAIIGFSDVPDDAYAQDGTVFDTKHFVVTDVNTATATVDADTYGAGYFNTADMGVKVDADLKQDYVGSGWASPTYSGGITMWAKFDGACDPFCSNPIVTSVSGTAGTSIFPPNTALLAISDGLYNYGSGESHYWGSAWKTNPLVQNI